MTDSATSDDLLLLSNRPGRVARVPIDSDFMSSDDAEESENIHLVLGLIGASKTAPRYITGSYSARGVTIGVRDAQFREGLAKMPEAQSLPNSAVLVGQAATVQTLKSENRKQALSRLIDRFNREGITWGGNAPARVNDTTTTAAKAFLAALPAGSELPKISPDGEGGLLLLWQSADRSCLLVIDGWKLHLVEAPTTREAKYLEDVPFDVAFIPSGVLKAIKLG